MFQNQTFFIVGGHSPGLLGQLPVLCYWIKKKKEQQADAEVNTDELKELIREVTGENTVSTFLNPYSLKSNQFDVFKCTVF